MPILKLLNPRFFTRASTTLIPVLFILTISFTSVGLYYALIVSPADYQQGEMVRIMYVHVPASWMALGVYTFIAVCSFSNLVWKTTMSYLIMIASAPIGALFSMISLVSGSIWGKPIWGTWWVWDARLTSMLILFLLYISLIIIIHSGDNIRRAEKPASVIALIGFINIPIIKFSVNIWYSLHQPASIIRFGSPAVHSSMLIPLTIMFASFIAYFLLLLAMRTVVIINLIKKHNI